MGGLGSCGSYPLLCLSLQHSEQEVETILDKSLILFRYLQDKVLTENGGGEGRGSGRGGGGEGERGGKGRLREGQGRGGGGGG